jgi:hypothetical protein
MKLLITLTLLGLVVLTADSLAQQPQVLPLTEWRAQIDSELSKIQMTREAHGQIIALMQAAERQAQAEKMARAKSEPPPKGEGQ